MQPQTTSAQVLDCPMGKNDADAKTIRGYLGSLLINVWIEEEGFDGKRPFGNSSWKYEVYAALAEQALITASKDEWNDWDYDEEWADQLVRDAIRVLVGSTPSPEEACD